MTRDTDAQRAKIEVARRAKRHAQAIRRALVTTQSAQQRLIDALADLTDAETSDLGFAGSEMEKAAEELETARRRLLDHIAICRHEEEN